ncbi:MAG: ribosomal protein S18-alanine N-acetyltransferase [Chloroflexota bacterium]|jgi:ribosomal-protein-alanine N-acetyltransferase|nr:ribosomal protein S18-alanine N-acetyltransferase [Chloroflexota bacterium]
MPLNLPEGKVSLRPMTLADLDQVVAIDRVSFLTPWPKDAFRYDLVREKNSIFWVAERTALEKPAEIIGSIVIWLVGEKAHIGTLAVKPGYRQCGVAQYLLARALIACAQKGEKQVFLEVRESNWAAQKLYRKFGFEAVGLQRGYYKDTHEDAILMALASLDESKLADLAKTE